MSKLGRKEYEISAVLKSDCLAVYLKGDDKSIDFVYDLFTYAISGINSFLNLKRTLTAEQLAETAELMVEQFKHWMPEDVSQWTKNVKSGHYGSFYESLDGLKLIDTAKQFAAARDAQIANLRQQGDSALKEEFSAIPGYIYDTLKKHHPVMQRKVKPIVEVDAEINEVMKDFDRIWEEQGANEGKKYIEYEGKVIDLDQYLRIRFPVKQPNNK